MTPSFCRPASSGLPLVGLLLLVPLLLPPPASAYEDMAVIGGHAGAAFHTDGEASLPCCGALLGVSGAVGVGDTFSLGAALEGVVHPGAEASTTWLGLLALELTYALDIVSVVPFFGLGLDAAVVAADASVGAQFGAHAILGAEYLLSRSVVIGVDIRPRVFLLGAGDETGIGLLYITASARVSYRFDL